MSTLQDAVGAFVSPDPVRAEDAIVELSGRGASCLAEVLPLTNAKPSHHRWCIDRLARLNALLGEEALTYLTDAILNGEWKTKGLAAYSYPCDRAGAERSRLLSFLGGEFDTARHALVALGRSGARNVTHEIGQVVTASDYANDKLASYAVEAMLFLAEFTEDPSGRAAPLRWVAKALAERTLHADGHRAPSYDDIVERHLHELSPRSIDALVSVWIEEARPRVQALGVQALGAIRAERTRPTLARLALSPDTDTRVRSASCWALANLGGQESFDVVRKVYTTDMSQHSGVGRALARLLPWSKADVSGLARALTLVEHADVYVTASRGYIGDLAGLEDAAHSPNPFNRASAALALGRLADPRGMPLLEQMREEASTKWEVAAVLTGLALQGASGAAETLHLALCEALGEMEGFPNDILREVVTALAGSYDGAGKRASAWAKVFNVNLTRALREVETLRAIGRDRQGEPERATAAPLALSKAIAASEPRPNPPESRKGTTSVSGDFQILHLTDLHRGLRGARHLWDNVRSLVLDDLKSLVRKTGAPDVVVFSGDLTQSASPGEFDLVEETLQDLWGFFAREFSTTPELVCVPGNHDLVWRKANDAHAKVLAQFHVHADVQAEFWGDAKSEYRHCVARAFEEYESWQQRSSLPRPKIRMAGALPGDVAYVVSKGPVAVGFLCLNTAFLQLLDGKALLKTPSAEPYKGLLALGAAQGYLAGERHFAEWLRTNGAVSACLVTHHPPDWLHPDSRAVLRSELAPSGRFLAHLYGHMHENAAVVQAVGGALPRCEIQGRSLFGLEELPSGASRSHGYGMLKLKVEETETELRIFPRSSTVRASGDRAIVPDQSFELDHDEGTRPVRLKCKI